ncbi:hypothetical protein PDJ99_24710 [Bacillus cereus]|nr:hypothetical protein [Bacillus cereus]
MEHIKKIIYDLLFIKRSEEEDTSWFTDQKHNAHLCPGFQGKFESIFESFEKYKKIVYDIQGPRDAGTDVIIRQTINDKNRYICFQIKSEDDLKRKDYLKDLKAQFFDTMDKFGENVLDFYIVLCCDKIKNKEKIRLIESEFVKRQNIYVVEPDYALTFLHLSSIQIDAMIRSMYGDEDVVFKEGLAVVQNLTPTQKGLLYYFIYQFIFKENHKIYPTDITNYSFINDFYKKIPDFDDAWFFTEEDQFETPNNRLRGYSVSQRISNDLEALSNLLITGNEDGSYSLHLITTHAIVLLMIDGNIRYLYTENDLIYYMLDLFGPMKGYESNTIMTN